MSTLNLSTHPDISVNCVWLISFQQNCSFHDLQDPECDRATPPPPPKGGEGVLVLWYVMSCTPTIKAARVRLGYLGSQGYKIRTIHEVV